MIRPNPQEDNDSNTKAVLCIVLLVLELVCSNTM